MFVFLHNHTFWHPFSILSFQSFFDSFNIELTFAMNLYWFPTKLLFPLFYSRMENVSKLIWKKCFISTNTWKNFSWFQRIKRIQKMSFTNSERHLCYSNGMCCLAQLSWWRQLSKANCFVCVFFSSLFKEKKTIICSV